MHKIVLSLLIFCEVSVHAMLQITPPCDISYKKAETTFYNIPADVIFNWMFPCENYLKEIATLIKKFSYKKNSIELIKLISDNLLTLIHFSQTTKHFYAVLQLNKGNISSNSIFTYYDYQAIYFKRIFYLHNERNKKSFLTFSFYLIRQNKYAQELQMYDIKKYPLLHIFCEKTIKTCDDQQIKTICTKIQESCKNRFKLLVEDIQMLRKFLKRQERSDEIKELDKYTRLAQVICPTILSLEIFGNNEILLQNIKARFLNKESLVSILVSNEPISENIASYVHAYNSFLQTLGSLELVQIFEKKLVFQTNCGISNEPTIPMNIICDENLKIKDK